MLEEAIKCYNNGWSVLPVKPHEKRPFMSNWLQYMKQRPSPTNIKSWFKDLKGAGLGVVTGKISNIIVIDVEHDSPYTLDQLLKKYPTSLISKTGSGGYHLFYQYPQNRGRIANRVRMLDGVDLRADGGFIVLPPTVHACGGKYEWLQYGVPGRFPEELLQLESQSTSGECWISDIYKGVAEGGRNQAAASLAGYFFKKGLPRDIIEMLMFEWNEKNDPPLPTQEIHTVIDSISKRHKDIVSFTSVEFIDDMPSHKKQNTSTFDLLKLEDYIRAYGGDGASYCIDKWLPEKSIIFLVSPPESYKTWILLDAAISVASGLPFLGEFTVNKKGAVFIIQQEDSHNGMTERLSVIAQSKFNTQFIMGEENQIPLIPDMPIYIHPSRQLRFTNKEVLKEIEKQIQEIKPELVIIDPLYSAITSDNYMAQGAEQMMILKEWRDKYDCSFLIAHHSKKSLDPDSTAREDSWGSQFLNAFQEGGWQIRRSQKLADNEVVVRRHSKVMGNQKLVKLHFDISTKYPMQYNVITSDYVIETNENESKKKPMSNAKDQIYKLLRHKAATQGEICLELGRDVSTISRHLKQLELTNLVQKLPDGKYISKMINLED